MVYRYEEAVFRQQKVKNKEMRNLHETHANA